MSVVYAWPLLEAGVYDCMVCEQPAVDGQSVAAVTNKKKVAVHASTWAFFTQNAALWQ